MRCRQFFQAAVAAFAVLPLIAAGAEQKVSCPLTLLAEALVVRGPTGWTGYTPSLMRLTGMGMMAGPPESMTYLVPSESKEMKDGKSTKWRFAGGDEKWLYCLYDGSSVIQISRRMADSATECTVRRTLSKLNGITSSVTTCTTPSAPNVAGH